MTDNIRPADLRLYFPDGTPSPRVEGEYSVYEAGGTTVYTVRLAASSTLTSGLLREEIGRTDTDGPAVEWNVGGYEERQWLVDGKRHRTDGPAIERADGSREWFTRGKRHREDGPAVEMADGTREWWVDGELHRTDGPAIERADGSREWFTRGKRHREDGPAVENALTDYIWNQDAFPEPGSREWWVDGELHRADGPAIERADGSREWFWRGKRHRNDEPGPAVENARTSYDRDSSYEHGSREWWMYGEAFTEAEFARRFPFEYTAWLKTQADPAPETPQFGAESEPVPVDTVTVHEHQRKTPTGGTAHVRQHTRKVGNK